MKKKKLLGINFLCGAVSILAFLVLWNIAVQGELGKMLPGPIPVLEKFFTSFACHFMLKNQKVFNIKIFFKIKALRPFSTINIAY